jgi:hypothetical protein
VQESVSLEAWQRLKEIGFANNWNIISNDPVMPRKVIPKEILSFRELIKPIPVSKQKEKTIKNVKHGSKGKPAVSGNKTV